MNHQFGRPKPQVTGPGEFSAPTRLLPMSACRLPTYRSRRVELLGSFYVLLASVLCEEPVELLASVADDLGGALDLGVVACVNDLTGRDMHLHDGLA
jgi:hypothetical protein